MFCKGEDEGKSKSSNSSKLTTKRADRRQLVHLRTVDAESKLQGSEGGPREGLQRLELERTQEFKAESARAPRKKHVPAQCHDGLSWAKGPTRRPVLENKWV